MRQLSIPSSYIIEFPGYYFFNITPASPFRQKKQPARQSFIPKHSESAHCDSYSEYVHPGLAGYGSKDLSIHHNLSTPIPFVLSLSKDWILTFVRMTDSILMMPDADFRRNSNYYRRNDNYISSG